MRMDWLTVHDAMVSCKNKQFILKCSNQDLISVESERSDCTSNLISALKTQKFIHKGVEAFLAYILDTSTNEPKIDLVSIVREFKDIFPEELSGLQSERKIKFVIEVTPGTSPISVAPYQLASTELKELKT